MTDRSLSYQDMMEIIRIFESSPHLGTLHVKFGDTEIDLDKHRPKTVEGGQASAPANLTAAQASAAEPLSQPVLPKADPDSLTGTLPAEAENEGVLVRSEMVGTFYRAAEPGAVPFVQVGQHVDADTTICIIEVMKLMTSVPAGRAGVVTRILVGDGETVEFGQPLIAIAPDE